MDKIAHQVRAEHWTKIMTECINSGRSKTAWCRANGISEKLSSSPQSTDPVFYPDLVIRKELSHEEI